MDEASELFARTCGWHTVENGLQRRLVRVGAMLGGLGEELLGFDDYFQVGVGAVWDCSELVPLLQGVGISVSFLYGENVQGWSLGGAFRF